MKRKPASIQIMKINSPLEGNINFPKFIHLNFFDTTMRHPDFHHNFQPNLVQGYPFHEINYQQQIKPLFLEGLSQDFWFQHLSQISFDKNENSVNSNKIAPNENIKQTEERNRILESLNQGFMSLLKTNHERTLNELLIMASAPFMKFRALNN